MNEDDELGVMMGAPGEACGGDGQKCCFSELGYECSAALVCAQVPDWGPMLCQRCDGETAPVWGPPGAVKCLLAE